MKSECTDVWPCFPPCARRQRLLRQPVVGCLRKVHDNVRAVRAGRRRVEAPHPLERRASAAHVELGRHHQHLLPGASTRPLFGLT